MDGISSLPLDEDSVPFFYIGQHETERRISVSEELFGHAQELGYAFLTTPITTKHFHARVISQLTTHQETLGATFDQDADTDEGEPTPSISPLTSLDTDLQPGTYNTMLVGVVSPWIDVASPDPIVAHVSRQVLHMELAYAAFCGIVNVVMYGPVSPSTVTQFSQAVREALGVGPFIHLQILLPMSGELEQDYGDASHLCELAREQYVDESDDTEDEDGLSVWDSWNAIRTVCRYSPHLSIALELPSKPPALSVQNRWYAEPVRFLVFPRTSFLRNPAGYPVLPKQYQELLSRFMRLRFAPGLLLSDVATLTLGGAMSSATEPTPAEAASKFKETPSEPTPHLQYLRHLEQKQPPRPPMERFGKGYLDTLQIPLQPLTNNLESITYEVFEKDPVKYEWYERAITAALKDLNAILNGSRDIVVAIVGAGRGPLVSRTLQASRRTGVAIQCWAVEKNPNAFVMLQRRNATDSLWNGQVHVVKTDMRHWSGPTVDGVVCPADLMVSELLGSFGDNELSPECLDGAQHVLHPQHGVNIPQRYSAHLTPISTPRMHADLAGRAGTDQWDMPYVVMLQQHDALSTSPDTTLPDVQCAWSFRHPQPRTVLEHHRIGDGRRNEHNARSCALSFACARRGVCHGLAGYFETVLYGGPAGRVELSINPTTMADKSRDMISWFPVFFPLQTPLYVPADSELRVFMWRLTDDRSVWYDWMVEVWGPGGADTTRRCRRRVAASELHSSRKQSCSM